jgi:S-methylmethionine-dependent homocysteine/selenocysteine methylase
MSQYRNRLPQLRSKLFLTDGGIETDLIFNQGVELPDFAAFALLASREGREHLYAYYRRYARIARSQGMGFILESPTWRASSDWAVKLGYSAAALEAANRKAISLMEELRNDFAGPNLPIVISGCIGPRGDGYVPGALMTLAEARAYHAEQITTFAETNADMVTAMTITNVNEAIGITQAARAVNMPAVISFTLETDGNLPTGQSLWDAIDQTDHATGRYVSYYMINCAHPDHFDATLASGGHRTLRLRGVRANASRCSHAELNEAPELDIGNPAELARQYAGLRNEYPHINVIGGCCGTDHRHIEEMAIACQAADWERAETMKTKLSAG